MKKNRDLTEEEIAELKKGPTDKINPYKKTGILSRIPFSIKALVLKWWAYGVGVFFIFWGTTNLILGNSEDVTVPNQGQILILGILLALFNGIINDVVINHFIELMDDDKNKSRYFLMFHNKKLYSLFINLVYSFIITYICIVVFENVAALINLLLGFEIAVEPITTGLLLLGIDMFFILIKNLIVKLVKTIKERKGSKNV